MNQVIIRSMVLDTLRFHQQASYPPVDCGSFTVCTRILALVVHDDIIKWKHFLHYWSFVQGIHWSPVNSPHKGQWCGALICTWINGWINNGEAGDLRHHRTHYDVTITCCQIACLIVYYTCHFCVICLCRLWWQLNLLASYKLAIASCFYL